MAQMTINDRTFRQQSVIFRNDDKGITANAVARQLQGVGPIPEFVLPPAEGEGQED